MDVQRSLTACDQVLVAFDGPIAELPPTDSVAERLRAVIADARLPRKVARTADPLVVLDYAATIGPATAAALHRRLGWLEHEAVTEARLTPGAGEAMKALAAAGTRIAVVSGLTHGAVRAFLVLHGIDEHVTRIAARARPDRSALPPAPDVLTELVRGRDVADCAFVASTDDDLAAGRAAGVRTYRYRRPAEPPVEPVAERVGAVAPRFLVPPRVPWFEALAES
jgi:beta-phosphoglucomutase-like phosphatase (HAD superfamily)